MVRVFTREEIEAGRERNKLRVKMGSDEEYYANLLDEGLSIKESQLQARVRELEVEIAMLRDLLNTKSNLSEMEQISERGFDCPYCGTWWPEQQEVCECGSEIMTTGNRDGGGSCAACGEWWPEWKDTCPGCGRKEW